MGAKADESLAEPCRQRVRLSEVQGPWRRGCCIVCWFGPAVPGCEETGRVCKPGDGKDTRPCLHPKVLKFGLVENKASVTGSSSAMHPRTRLQQCVCCPTSCSPGYAQSGLGAGGESSDVLLDAVFAVSDRNQKPYENLRHLMFLCTVAAQQHSEIGALSCAGIVYADYSPWAFCCHTTMVSTCPYQSVLPKT